MRRRYKALWDGLGLPEPAGDDRAAYYAELDVMVWAEKFYGTEFVEFLRQNHECTDILFRLAEEIREEKLLFHVILNAYWQPLDFELPRLDHAGENPWRRWIDTASTPRTRSSSGRRQSRFLAMPIGPSRALWLCSLREFDTNRIPKTYLSRSAASLSAQKHLTQRLLTTVQPTA